MPKVMKAFETISMAKVSTSAAEAYDLKFLRRGIDEIVMNRDRLLSTAKEKALSMVADYQAPEKHIFSMPGASGKAAIQMAIDGFKKQGIVLPHDEVVLDRLANVLTGGSFDMTDRSVP
jgi:3-hydroxyacyl-CoA dehydrogenase